MKFSTVSNGLLGVIFWVLKYNCSRDCLGAHVLVLDRELWAGEHQRL